jgi:hypothetical protein
VSDNRNTIVTDRWSSSAAERLYVSRWPDEPACQTQYEEGRQCGGCSFFAPFNQDWGLCCRRESRHHLQTVFEHFTCPQHVDEGWGPHSFTEDASFHCRCGGEGSEYWDQIAAILANANKPTDT